jgi:hypothetical protein
VLNEIKKSASQDEIKVIIKKNKKRNRKFASFFGKLPKIEDGLKYQKKTRNEWE